MPEQVYLAVDLGASSGRVLAAHYDGQRVTCQEMHRFENGPVEAGGTLYWDYLRLWQEIKRGMRLAHSRYPNDVVSLGVDAWRVDFALLAGESALGNPVHYRDRRTEGMLDRAFAKVGRAEIFAETGLQFMQINTLYQLIAMRQADHPALRMADCFLMMPDLFHWLLTGFKGNEYTNATTTQFFNPSQKRWSTGLFAAFDLPTNILQPIVPAGTNLGMLRASVAQETGFSNLPVIAPGTHDTASAVLAVPAGDPPSDKPRWCFLSSGTWSLLGAETIAPVINARCQQFNFTNEGGVGGTNRLLKNISGLWRLQECQRVWADEGRQYSWGEMTDLAAAATPLVSLINPDDASLLAPAHMPQAIQALAANLGERPPQTPGEILRCALESLAMQYRRVLTMLEELTESRIETIHVVGGGSLNQPLCQATADACQRRVIAGPVEATALGNVVAQMIASGAIQDATQGRDLVRRSFPSQEYLPRDAGTWTEAFERFKRFFES